MAPATCRRAPFTADPATDHNLPVLLGGRNMDLPGFSDAPSLVYAARTPAFSNQDQSGGFFRDGRASSLEVQAQQPFITEFERANADTAEVAMRLQASSGSLALFTAAFGSDVIAFLCTLTDGFDLNNPGAYLVPAQCAPQAQ